ncbi:transcription factor bHLH66-like [Senna tora]|uniref:Transcription factor bHLH66-like n=1 Tax=Senna tora TaxID=362788 RepID=A0A834WP03_9FABA|nr:transcription factor bHLH66-like [Senna tora]
MLPPPHFGAASLDDFQDQMLSTLPSCSWSDLNPINPKPFCSDLHPSNPLHIPATANIKPRELFDDAPSPKRRELTFTKSSTTVLMLQAQQQLLMSRDVPGVGDSGILSMPLSLGDGEFD